MNNIIKYSGFILLLQAISPVSGQAGCTPTPDCASIGYNKSASECPSGSLKCPWDTSKVFCGETECIVGSVLYEDMQCYEIGTTDKTPIGVVFDHYLKYAVALEHSPSKLEFGGYQTDISTLTNCGNPSATLVCESDGSYNTSKIIAYGKANNISYPAAEYCNNYSTTGTNAGNWHLPSTFQLSTLYINRVTVNKTLNKLGKELLMNSPSYVSSNEYSDAGAYTLHMGAGLFMPGSLKANKLNVRPVIQYGRPK